VYCFKESRLEFRFEAPWEPVFQWDRIDAYRKGLARLPSTSAVDFIGLHGSDPYFIEVKNFRGYRIDNKERLSSGSRGRRRSGGAGAPHFGRCIHASLQKPTSSWMPGKPWDHCLHSWPCGQVGASRSQ